MGAEHQRRTRIAVPFRRKSANAKKDWFADRYARVVDALERDFGYRTMLIGGPGARPVSGKCNTVDARENAEGMVEVIR